jgi:hypothetical protein
MNPNLIAAVAAEHQRELERHAGCCTPIAEHRRAVTPGLRERLPARRRAAGRPAVGCA